MCGIVGRVDSKRAVDAGQVRKAADSLLLRGPDDSGVWTEGRAGFGHRRLSILDTSDAGHQPMHSADGRYVIVFNGEIYNFNELRKELAAPVGGWKSHGDTETILSAYALWGADCLKKFNGMYAIAIWDRREQKLFAARDRMGVKPFYYSQVSGAFCFASRPRSLFELDPSLGRAADPQALRSFLEMGYIPAPHSIHRDIRNLPPAHYLELSDGKLTLNRYWDFREIPTEKAWINRSEGDLLDELDGILTRSVTSRMVSDVPLGVFLSGGVDSSLVTAIMARHTNAPVKTFTIGFDSAEHDESHHAEAVAKHLGTEHHCQILSPDDLLSLMPMFQQEFDEPFFDYAAFPTMAVSRLAREHVKVALSGDGGDELFGGYHYYSILQGLKGWMRWPGKFRGPIASLIRMAPNHRLRLLAGALSQKDMASVFSFSRSLSKDFGLPLDPSLLRETSGMDRYFRSNAAVFPDALEPMEMGMRLDALFTLPDDYLQKLDVASMAFSLEARDPLLSTELVEWSMRLPACWKMNHGQNKYLLRKLLGRYVPDALVNRPKQGFVVPIGKWMRTSLKSWCEERLHDKALFQRLPLVQGETLKLWDMHISGKRNVQPLLWAILILLDFASMHDLECA